MIRVKSEGVFLRALRKRFPKDRYIILSQVPMPSVVAGGIADSICLGVDSALDLSISGFEFKASRNDWLNELKKPNKCEAAASWCDYWTLLTYPGMADAKEIPPAWGHWVLDNDVIRVEKESPRLPAKAVDRPFVARLLTSVLREIAPIKASAHDMETSFQEGRKHAAEAADRLHALLIDRYDTQALHLETLRAKLRGLDLEKASREEVDDLLLARDFLRAFTDKRKALALLKSFSNIDTSAIERDLVDLLQRSRWIADEVAGKVQDLRSFKTLQKETGLISQDDRTEG